MKQTGEWLTVNEAANLTGFHPEHVRRLIREGKVTARKVVIVWLVNRESILEYQAQVKQGRPKSPHG